MAYVPKSKRNVIRDPEKAKLFNNLTNNKNIEDIQALANLNNGLADEVSELQSDVISLENDLNGKQDLLVSGVNIKTINSTSLLGSGDITISSSSSSERRSDYVYPYQYSGTAPVGTLDSGTWTIKRIDFTTPGSPITQQATGAWTNRYSLTYI
jgi:hypothetical protein